jgi:hypothetical protein
METKPMARGDNTQKQLSEQQLNRENARQDALMAERAQTVGQLNPYYQGLIGSQGYSPAERAQILDESMAATGTPFDVARSRIAGRTARTRNSAGASAAEARLAADEGRAKGATTRGANAEFAAEKFRRQQAGAAGMAGLQGMTTGLIGSTAGQAEAALGNRAKGIGTNVWDELLGGAAQVGSAYLGRPR